MGESGGSILTMPAKPRDAERGGGETTALPPGVAAPLREYWGFDTLRPLQGETIEAVLAGRDSVTVLPTGGGKSLCYQLPAMASGRTDLVLSPLISLMKDQVDALGAMGYPAVALHSHLSPDERREAERRIAAGEVRLVFAAPERVMQPGFVGLLRRNPPAAVHVDEAHCISHWGHDFRPEYRQIAAFRRSFPEMSLHGFTATATERVQADIAAQLELRAPAFFVGKFDRPNLTYRAVRRRSLSEQVLGIVRRHADEATIIYCISRRDTEALAAQLRRAGVKAACYHAGLSAAERSRVQSAFAAESLNVITATVAFGMGIDRSNVRCVIHAALPKSVEHYQQETGRAGRDGLPAECVLLYSAADGQRWKTLLSRSAEESGAPPEVLEASLTLLREMRRFAAEARCRHAQLVEYFGQELPGGTCGDACDVCRNEIEALPDGAVIAQKILSCVARLEERFGMGHVADVLRGDETPQVRSFGHASLSTFGLMRDWSKAALQQLIGQLLDQELLERVGDERPVLKLNAASWDVMRGERPVTLLRPTATNEQRAKVRQHDPASWEGVDRGLFEALRALRREIAQERNLAPFLVFSDATLRELSRARPTDDGTLRAISGVGARKAQMFGPQFLAQIREYCAAENLETDVGMDDTLRRSGGAGGRHRSPRSAKAAAFEMFDERRSIAEVAETLCRSPATVARYLADYIGERRPATPDPWLSLDDFREIDTAAQQTGYAALRPLFDALAERFTFEQLDVARAFAGLGRAAG